MDFNLADYSQTRPVLTISPGPLPELKILDSMGCTMAVYDNGHWNLMPNVNIEQVAKQMAETFLRMYAYKV